MRLWGCIAVLAAARSDAWLFAALFVVLATLARAQAKQARRLRDDDLASLLARTRE